MNNTSTMASLVSSLLAAPSPTATEPAKAPRRAERRTTRNADSLRTHALTMLATRGPQTIPDIAAPRTDTTAAHFSWIVRTLLDRGWAKCLGRSGHHTALLYEITPAGCDALAATPPATPGDH